jgi:hypothetical protein
VNKEKVMAKLANPAGVTALLEMLGFVDESTHMSLPADGSLVSLQSAVATLNALAPAPAPAPAAAPKTEGQLQLEAVYAEANALAAKAKAEKKRNRDIMQVKQDNAKKEKEVQTLI